MSKTKKVSANTVSVNPVYLSARSAIVQPEQAIPVTLYAIKKWLPRLGTDRWSLIQLLRSMCFEAPRRADGTKRVTISWRSLAEMLQVHEETVASWLKHEVIPEEKPWRRIIPTDDYAEYLGLFIPRLRYAYETSNGKTRRVGFLLEVLMEDPIAPEDEIKLTQQLEMMQLQQGELGLETYKLADAVNRTAVDLPSDSPAPVSYVNTPQTNLPYQGQSNGTRFTAPAVNPAQPDSPSGVKQPSAGLGGLVTANGADLGGGKSELIASNVEKLEILINKLKNLKHQKRNYQQILEPIITLTEDLLEDYHSTAMLYKVLTVLFPEHTDIYLSALEYTLYVGADDPAANKGAVFVKTLRLYASQAGVDLGFRTANTSNQLALDTPAFAEAPVVAATASQTVTLEEAIWSETLNALQGQMTRAMYNSAMQGTKLLGMENGIYIVQAGSPLAKAWLENRLKHIVERALSNTTGSKALVEFRD